MVVVAAGEAEATRFDRRFQNPIAALDDTSHGRGGGSGERGPEPLIECLAWLDGDGLLEAAGGAGPLVEEADGAQNHEAVGVPADESDRRLPRSESIVLWVRRVQPELNGPVSGGDGAAAYGVRRLPLVVVKVDAELDGEQVAGEARVCARVDCVAFGYLLSGVELGSPAHGSP